MQDFFVTFVGFIIFHKYRKKLANSSISIIIVAAGSGIRMGHKLPKQFLSLSGVPILIRTLKNFTTTLPLAEIILVLPRAQITLWQNLCKKTGCNTPHKIAEGGDCRTQSVKNGLNKITATSGIVLIHDGVRPLTTPSLINKIVDATIKHKAVIPVTPITDSIRKVSGNENHSVNREEYKAVQTPQGFDIKLIKQAYAATDGKVFTDDAAVLENIGIKIELIEGEKTNIKITTPEDMVIARSILKKR